MVGCVFFLFNCLLILQPYSHLLGRLDDDALTMLRICVAAGFTLKHSANLVCDYESHTISEPFKLPEKETQVLIGYKQSQGRVLQQLPYDASNNADTKTRLMLWLLSCPTGFTCWISFAPVFSFMNC